jgi:hypothetical protein
LLRKFLLKLKKRITLKMVKNIMQSFKLVKNYVKINFLNYSLLYKFYLKVFATI